MVEFETTGWFSFVNSTSLEHIKTLIKIMSRGRKRIFTKIIWKTPQHLRSNFVRGLAKRASYPSLAYLHKQNIMKKFIAMMNSESPAST